MTRKNILLSIIAAAIILIIAVIVIKSGAPPVRDEHKKSDFTQPEPAQDVKEAADINTVSGDVETTSSEASEPVPEATQTPFKIIPVKQQQPTDADKAALEQIERQLSYGNQDERDKALADLTKMLEKGKGKSTLMKLWESDDPDVFNEALDLIDYLPESDRMEFVMNGLDKSNVEMRLDSLGALREFVEADVSQPLIKGMADKDEKVLEEVSDLFVYFNDKPIYEAATEGLQNPNEMIRDSAISFLQDKYTSKAVLALISALNSQYDDVVNKSGEALRFITDADIDVNNYDAWYNWWQNNSKDWLAEYGKDADEE